MLQFLSLAFFLLAKNYEVFSDTFIFDGNDVPFIVLDIGFVLHV